MTSTGSRGHLFERASALMVAERQRSNRGRATVPIRTGMGRRFPFQPSPARYRGHDQYWISETISPVFETLITFFPWL